MVVLRPDVSRLAIARGLEAVGGIDGLALAIISSPQWRALDATLVVRREPAPLLGVIGRIDEVARESLKMLRVQLDNVLPRVQSLDHEDVLLAVDRLARGMRARFGLERCRSFDYRAIPRGGHVVLGFLGYALGLDQERLETHTSPPSTLVLIDDCVITGRRVRMALDRLAGDGRVVVATLFSAPELRQALERDPRVLACVSAYDLRDEAPARHGEKYRAWVERWRDVDDRAYWVGQPQHLCFPWNEPDVAFWNERTERMERGWWLQPPDRCAKHRAISEPQAPAFQLQPHGVGPLRPHPEVLAARFGERVVIGAAGWSECLVLEGVAGAMWHALVARGNVREATRELSVMYDVDSERLASDLRAFAGNLVERGVMSTGDD